MKTAMIRPKPNNEPQTFELPQVYVKPPHCNASNKETMAQIRNIAPAISMFFSLSLTVKWLYCRSGFVKKKNTTASETAPNGRLIQKHHRQESRSVNAPPRIGPTTLAIPNIEDSAAMYMARFRSGTEKPIMVIPPEYNAAAPAPAIARPMMNMDELVAAAQMIDPTSNITSAERYVYLTSKYV